MGLGLQRKSKLLGPALRGDFISICVFVDVVWTN